MRNDFAVFILTHGRALDQKTYKLLRSRGYTGKIYLIVDDLDDQQEEYIKLYGSQVVVFDKEDVYRRADTMTNRKHMRGILYARIACDEIAKSMGLSVWCQMDDDLTGIYFRYTDGKKAKQKIARNLDVVFDAYSKFAQIDGIFCTGTGIPAYFIGGATRSLESMRRKISNVFFRNRKTDIRWSAVMNEDMITCNLENTIGHFMGSASMIEVTTKEVAKGKNKGGMQEMYKNMDSYERAFYAVLANPSISKVQMNKKGIFEIRTNLAGGVPELISDRWRKARSDHEE